MPSSNSKSASLPYRLLRSGEFAALCGTTKETILHFDRKGVLKPRHTTGSRYRGYHPEQIYEYEFVTLLQRTGASLEEIRCLKLESDTLAVDAHVEQGIARLRTEGERLLQQADDFEHRLLESREIWAAPKETLILCDTPAYRCTTVPIVMPDRSGYVDWFRGFCEYRSRAGLSRILPAGMILSSESLRHGEERPVAFFPEGDAGPDVLELASGRCALWYFTGTETDFFSSLKALGESLRERDLCPQSPALLFDGASYLKQPMDHMAAKIVLRVK